MVAIERQDALARRSSTMRATTACSSTPQRTCQLLMNRAISLYPRSGRPDWLASTAQELPLTPGTPLHVAALRVELPRQRSTIVAVRRLKVAAPPVLIAVSDALEVGTLNSEERPKLSFNQPARPILDHSGALIFQEFSPKLPH
jgi:hypothetical protein